MPTGTITFNKNYLIEFEHGIDPIHPQHSRIPAHVLGYGEMSTVMTISGANPNLVFKRMPMFHAESELEPYIFLYETYLEHLANAGVTAVPAAITSIVPSKGNIVVYIIQEKIDSGALLNKAIHKCTNDNVVQLFNAILANIAQVFTYNDEHKGDVAMGFDAQMSNWAITGCDGAGGPLPDPLELIYIDTSSPLLRLNGEELLDPELFLRSAPSFLRWVIRMLFLDDVMNRYYDPRQVIIDVLANLYKEKRAEIIPELLVSSNEYLEETEQADTFKPITGAEVASYYKEDARIWSLYLNARRIDRQLYRLLGRPYPYVLPGHVDR